MAQVSVSINGRTYQIACDDGQEANLSRLAAYVDKRIGELVAALGQVGDDRLLVMASLLVADELADSYTELDALRSTAGGEPDWRHIQAAACSDFETLAERIENIAERLEQS